MHFDLGQTRRVATLAFSFFVAACGSDATNNPNYGEPPDAALFNPGNGGQGDNYGSGSTPAPFVCPDALKRCAQPFSFPFNGESSVELRGDYRGPASWVAGDAMTHQGNVWTVTVNVPLNQPVQYKFFVNGTTWTYDPNQPTLVENDNTNNLLAPVMCNPAICDEPPAPPPGVYDWRDAVIYFVFVDRFLDGDPTNNGTVPSGVQFPAQYQGGDWKGVTSKINDGYFNDLGANVLWLTVPVKNADTYAGAGVGGDSHLYSSYHGYWPSDPSLPEPRFGALQDLKDLVNAAHTKGLRVLLDYAMVQVQIDSPIYQNNQSWFWPNSYNGGDCICGQNCDWNAQGDRCWFASYLPHWNYTVPAARDYSVNGAVQWIKDTGADGFRLDAIKQVDGSWLTQLRTQIQAQIVAPENPQQRFYMVGETYDFYNQQYIGTFVDPATKLDGQFDFPARRVLVDTMLLKNQGMDSLASFFDTNDYFYGTTALMSPFLGNHDLPRIVHLAQEPPLWSDQASDGKDRAWQNQPDLPSDTKTFEKLANAFAVMFVNHGAPLIYYGDEYGMPGAGDPDNRRMMQWTGYSSGQTYLHDRIKTLLAIRAAHSALRWGFRTTITSNADLWFFVTTSSEETVYVAINRGDSDQAITGLPNVAMNELVTAQALVGTTATVPARQTRIWIKK